MNELQPLAQEKGHLMLAAMNKQVRRFVLAILIFHARQLVGCTSFLARTRTGRIVVAFRTDPLDCSPLGQENPLKAFLRGVSARQKAPRLF